MDDAALGRKILLTAQPLVAQPRARAVGRRCHRAAPGLPANDLDVKMIDRHRDQISGTAERTSERRISAPSLEKNLGRDYRVSGRPDDLTALCVVLDYHFAINTHGDEHA